MTTDKSRDSGSVTIYGIRNCDTMKRAFAWLDANRVPYRFHDYKTSGIDAAKVKNWAGKTGWKALLNTRGTTWHKLTSAEQGDLDERKAVILMCEYPALIKRPVIDTGDLLLVGYDEKRYEVLSKFG